MIMHLSRGLDRRQVRGDSVLHVLASTRLPLLLEFLFLVPGPRLDHLQQLAFEVGMDRVEAELDCLLQDDGLLARCCHWVGKGGEGERRRRPSDHCLPSISISSVAALALLTRWCSASQKAGGFCNSLRRDAAEVLLSSILRSACSFKNFGVGLYFDNDWEFKWPRSERLHPQVAITVDKEGIVDLSSSLALVASGSMTSVASAWLNKLMRSPLVSGRRAPLKSILTCSFVFGLISLLKQLLFVVASRVEVALFDVTASVRHSAGVRNFSRCADKANVGGRQIQAGIICFPDGNAAVACPQVARGTARGAPLGSEGGAWALANLADEFRFLFWPISGGYVFPRSTGPPVDMLFPRKAISTDGLGLGPSVDMFFFPQNHIHRWPSGG